MYFPQLIDQFLRTDKMEQSLVSQIKEHALKCFPNEMVGCVVGGMFVPLENVSSKPQDRYQLRPKDKVMLFEMGDSLEALVHSHTNNDNKPSDMDINSFNACGFDFWIIGTDGVSCTEVRSLKDETTEIT